MDFESGVLRAFSGPMPSGLKGKWLQAERPPHRNILKVQALLQDLNYDSGSGYEKKETEMRNIRMEKKSMGLGNRPCGEEKGKTSESECKSGGSITGRQERWRWFSALSAHCHRQCWELSSTGARAPSPQSLIWGEAWAPEAHPRWRVCSPGEEPLTRAFQIYLFSLRVVIFNSGCTS